MSRLQISVNNLENMGMVRLWLLLKSTPPDIQSTHFDHSVEMGDSIKKETKLCAYERAAGKAELCILKAMDP